MILLWKPALCATGVLAAAVVLLLLFIYWPGWTMVIIVMFIAGVVIGVAWRLLYEWFDKRFQP